MTRFLVLAGLILFSLQSAYASQNIRVLILSDSAPAIPDRTEKIERLGSVRGDLLVMGTRYSGNIDVWKGTSGLYIINELPLEDYIKDVVVAEVSADWDIEALKAQAVVSRTYALYQKKANSGSVYHIASSVLNQVYRGNNPDARVARAVDETRSEILTYRGLPIEAFYHSTCGGKTENPEDVFGKSYPYLKSVESTCDISPYSVWEKQIEPREIEKALKLRGIRDIVIKSRTSSGRVKELRITTSSGSSSMSAPDFRKALGWSRLPSTNFSVQKDDGSFLFEGKGYGHGVGLCQWCALKMAREGKTYKEILSHFYPGATITLYENR